MAKCKLLMQTAQTQKLIDFFDGYSDDEAEASACGTSKSVVSTAMQCASHAVGMWLANKNNIDYLPNERVYINNDN